MSRPTADALEEVIDVILSGKNFGRSLTATEQMTIAAFENLMAEYTSRKMTELRYDAAQSRKEINRLNESAGMIEFAEMWPAEYPSH